MENQTRIRVMLYEPERTARRAIADMASDCNCDVIAIETICPCSLEPGCTCLREPGDACADAIISDVPNRFTDSFDIVEAYISRRCKIAAFALMSSEWHPDEERRAARLGVKLFYKPFPMDELRQWLVEISREAGARRQASAPAGDASTE